MAHLCIPQRPPPPPPPSNKKTSTGPAQSSRQQAPQSAQPYGSRFPPSTTPAPPSLDRSTSTRTPSTAPHAPTKQRSMENLASGPSTPTRSISQREPPRASPSMKKKPTNTDGVAAGSSATSPASPNANPYGSFAPAPPPGTANIAAVQQSPLTRERAERPAPPPPGTAAQSLQKAAAAASQGVATPRRREKKDKANEVDIVKRLREICTDADPTRLYRNLVKIGQGFVSLKYHIPRRSS